MHAADRKYLIITIILFTVNSFFSFTKLGLLFQFFEHYEKLLMSSNYVTRRQSLKVSPEIMQLYVFFFLFSLKKLIHVLWLSASIRISIRISQFSYNEALYCWSSPFESHDDIVEGIWCSLSPKQISCFKLRLF